MVFFLELKNITEETKENTNVTHKAQLQTLPRHKWNESCTSCYRQNE